MPTKIMHVYFREGSGEIYRISPRSGENSIPVPIEDVRGMLTGKESKRHYFVDFNPKTKSLELKHKGQDNFEGATVNDYIYEIPTNDVKDPDLSIVQDIPNTCWKIELGSNIRRNIKEKGVRLNTVLKFSVTEKNDPNILYKTLSVDFSQAVRDNYVVIPFDMKFETTNKSISIYTDKRFDTYQFKRILND